MNINTATRDQLQRALQVDGQRAEYIIEERRQLGGFQSWDQFKREVPAFEDKMVENLERAGLEMGPRSGEQRAGGETRDPKPHAPDRGAARGHQGVDVNDASADELSPTHSRWTARGPLTSSWRTSSAPGPR